MKRRIVRSLLVGLTLAAATNVSAWWGNNWGWNPYDPWDPRFWMEEFFGGGYYGGGPWGYGGGPWSYGGGPWGGYGYPYYYSWNSAPAHGGYYAYGYPYYGYPNYSTTLAQVSNNTDQAE
jgi:hypothetical protein